MKRGRILPRELVEDGERRRAQAAQQQRAKMTPTPTQSENDRAALGETLLQKDNPNGR